MTETKASDPCPARDCEAGAPHIIKRGVCAMCGARIRGADPMKDWRDDYARRLPRGTVGRGWRYRA